MHESCPEPDHNDFQANFFEALPNNRRFARLSRLALPSWKLPDPGHDLTGESLANQVMPCTTDQADGDKDGRGLGISHATTYPCQAFPARAASMARPGEPMTL